MMVIETNLNDAAVLDPTIYGDERGYFFEGFNRQHLAKVTGYDFCVAQTNHSRSQRNILRGMHFQVKNVQAKFVWVAAGEIFDAIVDLRRSSSTFGQWYGTNLSSENRRRIFVPEGFAHGFLVLSGVAEVSYLTSDIYNPDAERFLRWNCPKD